MYNMYRYNLSGISISLPDIFKKYRCNRVTHDDGKFKFTRKQRLHLETEYNGALSARKRQV